MVSIKVVIYNIGLTTKIVQTLINNAVLMLSHEKIKNLIISKFES
jgi:hypothetical protein